MRIATFNLKDFFEPRSDDEAEVVRAKRAHVADRLREADADVVALQEVGSVPLLQSLVDEEARALGYTTVHAGPADKRGIGCAILGRLPVVHTRVVAATTLTFPRFVASDPSPYALPQRRPLVHVRFDAGPVGPVDVFTVHFKSRLAKPMQDETGAAVWDRSPRGLGEAYARSWVMRTAEALHARGEIDAIFDADPNACIIVMGDFNDTVDSLPTRIVRANLPDVELGRVLHSCTDVIPAERRYSILHGGKPDLLDHVLVSPALAARLTDARILNETLRDHGPYAADIPLAPDSDHAMVVATFKPARQSPRAGL